MQEQDLEDIFQRDDPVHEVFILRKKMFRYMKEFTDDDNNMRKTCTILKGKERSVREGIKK